MSSEAGGTGIPHAVSKRGLHVARNRRRRERDSSYSEEDEARLSDSDNEERLPRSSPDRSSAERGGRSEDSDRYRREDRSRRYDRSESDSDDDRDARSQEVSHPATANVHRGTENGFPPAELQMLPPFHK